MVQELEIRNGNWFHHNVSVWSYRNDDGVISSENNDNFQWVSSDWYGLGDCTMSLEAIDLIPVNDFWLNKFGFYNVNHIHGYSFYTHKKYKIDLYNEKTCFMGYLVKKCDFVHQIQNLIFTLYDDSIS